MPCFQFRVKPMPTYLRFSGAIFTQLRVDVTMRNTNPATMPPSKATAMALARRCTERPPSMLKPPSYPFCWSYPS